MAKQWEAEHDGMFFWGGTGKDCMRAAWLQATLAAFARHRGLECGSFFSDLEKFYEKVEHRMLAEEAVATGFPSPLLFALLGLYSAPRAISYNGCCSKATRIFGTILAGCSCATTLAKVSLYRLLT
jgi:hypothetical protein